LFGLSAFRGALLLHCEPNYFVVPAPIRTLLSSGRIIFGSGFENCPEFGCELVVEETGVTRKYKRYHISEIITIAMVCIKKNPQK
jgi:hypothetical protein